MECLIYANGNEERGKELASVLRGHGVRATRPVEPDECFDLLARHPWGCLVLAADGATRDVLDVLTRCRRTYPEVPPLVLVKHGDINTTVQMMKAGAADCMETPVETGRLLAAVTTLCRRAGGQSRSYRAHLTRMERTVLGHILEGYTNREIAQLLCRSPRTIEVHRCHVMRKLGAANLVDLVKQMMSINDTGPPGGANGSPGDATVSGALEIGLERSGEDR